MRKKIKEKKKIFFLNILKNVILKNTIIKKNFNIFHLMYLIIFI